MDAKFSIVKKGYDTDEVDQYISELEQLIEQRNQELADYKQKERAINGSLIQAQEMSERIKQEADQQAKKTIEKARTQAAQEKAASEQALRESAEKLLELRHLMKEFKEQLNTLTERYLVQAKSKDLDEAFSSLDTYLTHLGLKPSEEKPVSLNEIAVSGRDSKGRP